MRRVLSVASFVLLSSVRAQQVGTQKAENHPKITTQKCTKSGCTEQSQSIVLDANWRWLHTTSGYANCYTGNSWDASLCPDGATCAKNCALDGADYPGTYGITTSGNALTLKFVTGSNVGSRVYLMASDSKYQLFQLKNQEFSFDVDMSALDCGLNGAVYLSEMEEDGGLSKYPSNKAGAKYGTGYCDSQCPHDIKFINGEANVDGWVGTSANSGSGKYGACCAEMDIWEANFNAAAYTPHPCKGSGLTRCDNASDCGDGDNRYKSICDKDGCDFNSWRMGDQTFLGNGKTVDTSKKFTIVTQFITNDGTSSGSLSEIRRLYIQNNKVIENSQSLVNGVSGNSISDSFCSAQKTAFGDNNGFSDRGGLKAMGDSLGRGMVLALSLWDDYAAQMLWLDSNYPVDKDPSQPGISRGPCSTSSGKPADVESKQGSSSVTYSNIKWGDIGSTYGNSGTVTTITTSDGPTSTSNGGGPTSNPGTVPQWGQCGGNDYSGPTTCASPYTCHKVNDWYSQCY